MNDRVQISYDLAFKTPFHFGTGIRTGLIDRTIVRDGGGYLYVPGSTFKGVLRERCEQLARLYEELDEDMLNLIASPHEEDVALRGLGQKITMITRIFGSHNHPGRLYFEDAHQTNDAKREYDEDTHEADETKREYDNLEDGKGKYLSIQTELYTQVRLDRPTRTAVKGALYTSEFGIRDLTFQGSITGWLECTPIDLPIQKLPTYSLLLLLAGLHMVDRLGGNKSTGKGHCTCNVTQVAINGEQVAREEWSSWLDHLYALSLYSTNTVYEEDEA